MMTEMDKFSRRELEARRDERAAQETAEAHLRVARRKTLEATVDTIRELHSRGYTDQQMADVLGVQRKVVNSMRLYGQVNPVKVSEAPDLNSAGKGQGGPVEPRKSGVSPP
jgi:hypothetical protein